MWSVMAAAMVGVMRNVWRAVVEFIRLHLTRAQFLQVAGSPQPLFGSAIRRPKNWSPLQRYVRLPARSGPRLLRPRIYCPHPSCVSFAAFRRSAHSADSTVPPSPDVRQCRNIP